jgi:hypothetical protein
MYNSYDMSHHIWKQGKVSDQGKLRSTKKNPYLSQFTAFPSYEFWVGMTVVKLAGARAVLIKGKKH